jgi:hypothetical protein
MIKHFCDICEEELASDRVNRNNLVLVVENVHIAIAINLPNSGEDYTPSICPACLFDWANIAKEKFFKLGVYREDTAMPLEPAILLKITPDASGEIFDEASSD